jgi:hypothetical protein
MEATETIELAKELSVRFTLTHHQALDIAVRIRQNELYKSAHVLVDGNPSSLEAIAIALGYSKHGESIAEALNGIANSIPDRR